MRKERKKNVDGQTVDPNNEGGPLESKFGDVYYYYIHTCRVKVHTYKDMGGGLGSERPRKELWGSE